MSSPIWDSRSLLSNRATRVLRYKSKGGTHVSVSKLLTGVALYAPATVRRQRVCAAISPRVTPFGRSSVVGVWNAEAPYATAPRITFVYISLALARLQPQADAASLVSAKFWVDSLNLPYVLIEV